MSAGEDLRHRSLTPNPERSEPLHFFSTFYFTEPKMAPELEPPGHFAGVGTRGYSNITQYKLKCPACVLGMLMQCSGTSVMPMIFDRQSCNNGAPSGRLPDLTTTVLSVRRVTLAASFFCHHHRPVCPQGDAGRQLLLSPPPSCLPAG